MLVLAFSPSAERDASSRPACHHRRHTAAAQAACTGLERTPAQPTVGLRAAPDLATRYRPLDRWLMSVMADATGGVSPVTVAAALADWWTHLAASPSKQIELAHLAASQALQFWTHIASPQAPRDVEIALPQDKRFADDTWNRMP